MCGIAGIVAFESRYAPSEELLRRMSGKIAHRGPDGEGIKIIRGPGETVAGFAHRRLAILDPDARSNQPFTAEYQGRKVHLTFNGEIYNFRELRRELETLLPGFGWRTTGDTEVILAAYFAWGETCVDKFLGQFAFAIFDEGNGTVFLVRDRMGEKPLYYGFSPGSSGIAFASELTALTCVPWLDLDVNDNALSHYFGFGFIGGGETIYRGVQKLDASATVLLGPEAIKRYCVYGIQGRTKSRPETHRTRELLESSVQSQLVSDVPLGCLLSGGVDSSIISLCAARAVGKTGQKLHTFTLAFDDPRYDESSFAGEVAHHLGTVHHCFKITPDAAADLPMLAQRFGEPFADSSLLPTYYLARETRQHVKVALSGDGGDELFGGYLRYRALQLTEKHHRIGRYIPVAALGRFLARGHPKSALTNIGRLLASSHLPAQERYELYMRLFPAGDFYPPSPLLGGAWIGAILSHALKVDGHKVSVPAEDIPDAVTLAMHSDQSLYLEADLLTKVDRASMAVALEVRCPFLDRHLVAYANSIPSHAHLARGPKALLRDAFAKDLPKSVFNRRKMGFAVPIGEWFRGSLRAMLLDLVLSPDAFCSRFNRRRLEQIINQHQTREVDHSQRLFALVMLELWHRSR